MRFQARLSTGGMIAAVFAGQVLGMAGTMSFPALQPEFQRLWALNSAEAGFVSGVYFAGYLIAVPVMTALTDRIEARRIYIAAQRFAVSAALGFALFAHGLASAACWRFLQGAGLGGAHMPGLRALSDAVPERRQSRAVAVFTATFTVGSSLSFALSGIAAAIFGWRPGLALLSLGPLIAAAVGFGVLPVAPRPPRRGLPLLPQLRPLLRNRAALVYVAAYGAHNGESSVMRAWIVALLAFAAARAGEPRLAGYATLVATAANLVGLPVIVLINEVAGRRDRRSVIAAAMSLSAALGIVFAAAALLSPVAAIAAAIAYGGAATADSGTINAGLVAAAEPERRGAFLAVHALAGFGAAALSPILFGTVLDIAGGRARGGAWIAAFAVQAAIGALWPLGYLWSVRSRRGR